MNIYYFFVAMGGDATAAVELAAVNRDCLRFRGAVPGAGAVGPQQPARASPRPHSHLNLLHR